MKQYLLILSILLTLMCLPPAQAREDGVLYVGFSEHPPWKVLNSNQQPGGIDIQLMQILAKRLNLTVEFVHSPLKRNMQMVEAGEIDLMTGILRRPDRENRFHFIEPAYKTSTNKAFFALKGQEPQITKHEDLRSFNIGTTLGSKYYPEFDNDKLIKRYSVSSTDLNIRMLLASRIDAFIMTESTGDYHIAKLGLTDTIVKLDYGYRKAQPVHMILSKKSPHAGRLQEFHAEMEKLVKAGTLQTLKTRFYKSLKTP